MDITREKLEKLYKKQQTAFRINMGVAVGSLILFFIVIWIKDAGVDIPAYWLILLFLFVFPLVVAFCFKKKLLPEGNSRSVVDAYRFLQRDFMSDYAVNMLTAKISSSSSFVEKTKLQLFLAEVYQFRGQFEDAVRTINSVDRSQFAKHPSTGMSYYGDVIGLYNEFGDSQSVLAAYRDAEGFIRECSERNYLQCNTAVSILINVSEAEGDLRKALDMKLMHNDFLNQFEKTTKRSGALQTAPLNRFLRGLNFLDTARLFYLNGEYQNAANSVDMGGPMLSESPYFLSKANDLSAKIKEKLNGG